MRRLALLACLAFAGCHTNPPAPTIEYKTEVIDTSCQTFAIIKIPAADLPKISDELKASVLAHDRAWVKACRKK